MRSFVFVDEDWLDNLGNVLRVLINRIDNDAAVAATSEDTSSNKGNVNKATKRDKIDHTRNNHTMIAEPEASTSMQVPRNKVK